MCTKVCFAFHRCWVGKRHLDLATQTLRDKLDVQIKWMPYQLNPHMPEEGIPMERYYTAKFGEQGAAMARDMNGSRCGKMGRAVVGKHKRKYATCDGYSLRM